MPKPDYLNQLIDQASAAAGNDRKLTKALGVGPASVYQWRNGLKSCPVADQVLMAELAGLKGEEWAARAIVAQYEGTAKGDMLYRALRKSLPAIGAAIASSGAHAHAIYSTSVDTVSYFIRCILC